MKNVELKSITLKVGDNQISLTEAEARAVYVELAKLFSVKVEIQREYIPPGIGAPHQWAIKKDMLDFVTPYPNRVIHV